MEINVLKNINISISRMCRYGNFFRQQTLDGSFAVNCKIPLDKKRIMRYTDNVHFCFCRVCDHSQRDSFFARIFIVPALFEHGRELIEDKAFDLSRKRDRSLASVGEFFIFTVSEVNNYYVAANAEFKSAALNSFYSQFSPPPSQTAPTLRERPKLC